MTDHGKSISDRSQPLTEEDRDALVREHLSLATRAAMWIRRRFCCRLELGELIALGEAGLVEAAARYDPGRGVRFSTFAWTRVHGAIIDEVRAQTPLPRRAWRKLEHAANDETPRIPVARLVSLEAVRDSGYEPAGEVDIIEQLDSETRACRIAAAIAALPPAERDIVRDHYWTDHNLAQAGAALGLSKSWTSRLHTRAIARMRIALENAGIHSAGS